MYNVLVLNKISKTGTGLLDPATFQCTDDCAEPQAIMLRSADLKGEGAIPDSVLGIARAGAGVNNIPVESCTERGIVVFNTPGANANAVREMVIGGLVLSSRHVAEAIRWVDENAETPGLAALVEKEKSRFVGPEFAGKKIGIIGLGAVGELVANAAVALGMEVYGYDPYISVDAAWRLSRQVHHTTDLAEIFRNSDYITLHVPENGSTRGMINGETIAQMKNGVRILNFARGGLVDTADIIAACESGKVACYVTDFPEEAIAGKKNIVCIPHLGASTPESEENCAVMAAKEIKEFLLYGSIRNSVNFDTCILGKPHQSRVTIINKNVPGMLSGITSTATAHSYNIENLVNRSRKGSAVAYTVLDIDAQVSGEFLKDLAALDGVIRVRLIR